MPSLTEITRQFWNILNLYPELHSRELRERVDAFILGADEEELFEMQRSLFAFALPYFLEDERMSALMQGLEGKKIGLAIDRTYESTITFHPDDFEVEWGVKRGYPVLKVASREAYRDGILRLEDPLKLILTRRIRIKHLPTLARWALPFWHILIDDTFYAKFLGYQDDLEERIEEELTRLGY